jgi:hypothetical protein
MPCHCIHIELDIVDVVQSLMGCESNDEHRFQVRATNRPENIVIRRTFIISEVANLQHFHFSQLA